MMSPAISSSLGIVAYLALFAGVGVLFLLVNLLIGRFVRPADPHPEKLEIYECGEPTIGSSFVQFDLRFYVVALLFIIFEVEVAFFFPWAVVFGKSTHLMDQQFRVVERSGEGVVLTDPARHLYEELGVRSPSAIVHTPASLGGVAGGGMDQRDRAERIAHQGAKQLALFTIIDIIVFFAVLLVGFAYVWRRGDLDWVRAVSRQRTQRGTEPASSETAAEEPAMSV